MPKIWVTQLPAENYYCSPVLSIDEKIVYCGASALPDIHKKSQYFVALDAETGKEVWRLQLGINEVRSVPAISSDYLVNISKSTHSSHMKQMKPFICLKKSGKLF
jgi:outer membrane protein assembly factor BamB